MKKFIFFVLFLILVLIGVYAYFYWQAIQVKTPVSSHNLVIPPKPSLKGMSSKVRPKPIKENKPKAVPTPVSKQPEVPVQLEVPQPEDPSSEKPSEKMPDIPVSDLFQTTETIEEELIASRDKDHEEPIPTSLLLKME